MAVSRCTVSFGPYEDAVEAVAFVGLRGRIRPSRRVIEDSTGTVIVPEWVDVQIGSDGTASVSLPHTDQAGITPPGFLYEMAWGVRLGDPSPGDKPFALPVLAGSAVDFDRLEASPDVEGVVVPIAASVTQVQDAADSAADAASAASEAAASAAAAESSASTAQAVATAAESDADASRLLAVAAQESATTAQSLATVARQDADAAQGRAAAAEASAADAAIQAGAAQLAVNKQYTNAAVVGDNLVLTRDNGGQTVAGNVRGPQGVKGDVGDMIPVTVNDAANGAINLATVTYSAPLTRRLTLTGNVALLNMPPSPASTVSGTVTFYIKQAASGGPYTVTWPSALEWAGDAPAPAMPTVASSELIVHLLWTGTVWRAMVGGTFFP